MCLDHKSTKFVGIFQRGRDFFVGFLGKCKMSDGFYSPNKSLAVTGWKIKTGYLAFERGDDKEKRDFFLLSCENLFILGFTSQRKKGVFVLFVSRSTCSLVP